MKPYEVTALLAIAVLIILIFHFIGAKGEKKRIAIINADGSKVYVDAEIANESATMAKGLMGRRSLGENEGMLFVFKQSGIYSFWMLNTTIPLDAIHFADNGTVADIIEMEPCGLNIVKCRLYPPKAQAKYVLEVNQGFSEKNRIVIGTSRLDLSSLPAGS
ncbi:DUF192 domain-containing protein [Candidatus Micrarchaeota archaeon]|nr:DUF192 domain-containing protein [Candidatus Micrarchaeota archaeon]